MKHTKEHVQKDINNQIKAEKGRGKENITEKCFLQFMSFINCKKVKKSLKQVIFAIGNI